MFHASYVPYTFCFHFKARTSKGLLAPRKAWFLKICHTSNPACYGLGECAPLEGHSRESAAQVEAALAQVCRDIQSLSVESQADCLAWVQETVEESIPSLRFALEMAFLDLWNGGQRTFFNNSFLRGQAIPINGLIWMGNKDFMRQQIKQKRQEGQVCLKIKVGGIAFEQECALLEEVRQERGQALILRLDANGAFVPEAVLHQLETLSIFDIHSIEQPLAPGQPARLAQLCKESPIPIALDEELLLCPPEENKTQWLASIKPAYIVLKPTLLGGFAACRAWIAAAEKLGLGWWISSALESNLGLSALAQFTASLDSTGHQGLGTGQLYTNNLPSPLRVDAQGLRHDVANTWSFAALNFPS